MKQITECLDRVFANKKPLAKKWVGLVKPLEDTEVLVLLHYAHVVLIYDTKRNIALFEWWEKPADKRGLDSALEYLKRKSEEEL